MKGLVRGKKQHEIGYLLRLAGSLLQRMTAVRKLHGDFYFLNGIAFVRIISNTGIN